jgi:hypothetical protein
LTTIDVQDLRKEFVEELIFPAIQCNAVYEVLISTRQLLITGCLSSGNIPRPPSHRPSSNPNRRKGRLQSRLPRLHRQGQRPSPFRTSLLRSETRHRSRCPLASPRILQPFPRPSSPSCLRRRTRHPCRPDHFQAMVHGREYGPLQLRSGDPGGS